MISYSGSMLVRPAAHSIVRGERTTEACYAEIEGTQLSTANFTSSRALQDSLNHEVLEVK